MPPQMPNQNGSKPIYKKWWFWLIVVVIVLGVFGMSGEDSSEQKSTSNSDNVVENSADSDNGNADATNEEEFKASCQNIAYEELARNGDNYIDTPITFRGEIIQVSEEGDYTYYRINVTEDEYGYWDDTILVEYSIKEGESRFLEDDIVTVYGTCKGLYSYESVIGANVTIPSAVAEYIELS